MASVRVVMQWREGVVEQVRDRWPGAVEYAVRLAGAEGGTVRALAYTAVVVALFAFMWRAMGERLDAFERRMDEKMDARLGVLDSKMESGHARLEAKIEATRDSLDVKIDGVEERLTTRIDALADVTDHRLTALETDMTIIKQHLLGRPAA